MKQPARINYFFKDGYTDCWDTIKSTFHKCGRSISNAWDRVCDSFGELWDCLMGVIGFDEVFASFFKAIWYAIIFGINMGALVLSAVMTPIISAVFSGLQMITLIVMMLLVYLGFLTALFADWLYRSIKKISTSCPNCQEKYALPTYVCECGRHHTHLVPSKYGILARRCECGRKLQTTFFNGRQKLKGQWICPKCSYELDGAMQVDIPIPVVGGPSSGKTCYINMALSELEKNSLTRDGLIFEYKANDALGDDYEENKQNMEHGRLPLKTNDMRLKYYQFYLTPRNEKVRNLVSVCDVAGETYSSNDEMGKQIGYKYANAFLMVLDPLSITRFREEVADKIDVRKYGASEKAMDEVLDTLINTLENMKCLNSKNMIKTDVAVIFSKSDVPGLMEKIGPDAVKACQKKYELKTVFEAQNKVCEDFLIEYEEENFLNNLKSKFKSIQFFTVSALGHVENGKTFTPEGVEDPLLWLIDKASPSINLKDKWNKKI